MKQKPIPKLSSSRSPNNLLIRFPPSKAILLIIFLTLLLSAIPALAQEGDRYDLSWHTVDGGGITFATSETYLLGGTIGQPDAGQSDSNTYTLRGGFWGKRLVEPTSVTFLSFTASRTSEDVILNWETASEIDLLGFNLYRAASPDGERVKLNAEVIPINGPGGVIGGSYTYIDTDVSSDLTFYYWLEGLDLSLRVKEVAGPVKAEIPLTLPYQLYIPILFTGQ